LKKKLDAIWPRSLSLDTKVEAIADLPALHCLPRSHQQVSGQKTHIHGSPWTTIDPENIELTVIIQPLIDYRELPSSMAA
jgi:hypothetical protein